MATRKLAHANVIDIKVTTTSDLVVPALFLFVITGKTLQENKEIQLNQLSELVAVNLPDGPGKPPLVDTQKLNVGFPGLGGRPGKTLQEKLDRLRACLAGSSRL